ncbi:MAG: VWA domain-containing protein, partial [Deltaproteobacteria bacterium]|nr:VWA domain-containing protein [Deltaproteobacteria bacterium]
MARRRILRSGLALLVGTGALVAVALPAHAGGALRRASGAGDAWEFADIVAVETRVRAQVEVTTVTLRFERSLAADSYVLTVPAPTGAYVIDLALDQGAGFAPAAISADPPPPSYGADTAVDAALLQWTGLNPLTADLTLSDSDRLAIRVQFQRLLRRARGAVSFEVQAARCPLRSADDAPQVSLQVELMAARPIASLQVSGGTSTAVARGAAAASVVTQPTALHDVERLDISYGLQAADIAVDILAHRTPTADPLGDSAGYFMLIAEADQVDVATTAPRSLSLVVDRSGSMRGCKIDQARDASATMLDALRPSDTFNLHFFNHRVGSLEAAPVPADRQRIDSARDFVAALDADGSTNLNEAVIAGLGGHTPHQGCGVFAQDPGCAESDAAASDESDATRLPGYQMPAADADDAGVRYDAVILLSDGLPTSGIVDPSAIVDNARRFNTWGSRIFSVAVGSDADVPLLEALARDSRGRAIVLNNRRAEQQLAQVVAELFEDLDAVRVTDLQLSFVGLTATDTLPEQPPDLFSGGQLIVVGRYQPAPAASVQLTGAAGATPYRHDTPFAAPEFEPDNAFVKYLWATEKVQALLAEMARGGDREQLRQQITDLGLAYRIQTPYTSFSYRSEGGALAMDSGAAGCGCALERAATHSTPLLLALALA